MLKDIPLTETGGIAAFSQSVVSNDPALGATTKSKKGKKGKGKGKKGKAKKSSNNGFFEGTDAFSNI
jgi:hypothetical protein